MIAFTREVSHSASPGGAEVSSRGRKPPVSDALRKRAPEGRRRRLPRRALPSPRWGSTPFGGLSGGWRPRLLTGALTGLRAAARELATNSSSPPLKRWATRRRRASRQWRTRTHTRAVILPVVLLMIAMLALTMVGFLFFVRAEGEGIVAFSDGQQARLAAESGLEEVTALLRTERDNAAAYFDVPDRFRHALIWARDYKRDADPIREGTPRRELLKEASVVPAWRFSVVASRYDGPENTMRFGITPESAKLNLNVATDDQVVTLMTPLLNALQIDNVQDLIDSILDWRDEDGDTRGAGAENEYYNTLKPAYNAKNGRFDSVEELLLVKGITAAVLYGEDVNRNGMLDENEDDGEDSFPYYDNGDGILDYGIAPFLTVWAREVDVSTDNQPRISLWANAAAVQAQFAEDFATDVEEELDQNAVVLSEASQAFIAGIAGNQAVLQQMTSPADLYVGEETDPNGGAIPAELLASPVTLEEMPYIMDRLSIRPADQAGRPIEGLININAAPIRVLMTIPGMTGDTAAAIVAGRAALTGDMATNTAWLVTTQAVDPATFKRIAPYITARAYQFHVEVIGYADHVKTMRRLEWIIELVGPLAQIKYHRDLTRLGPAWPIDDENVTLVE